MNLNDYKDTNGNVEVSETLVSDLIEGINGVVESGSNENGSWMRFADGTQICWINIIRTDISVNNAYGSFFTGSWTWTFPQSFIDRPTVPSPIMRWGTSASWGTAAQSTTTNVQLFILDALTRPSGTAVLINAIAIGRWK